MVNVKNVFDITEYGAVSDGKTDCTKAIQSALDDARDCHGSVIVPPGEYLCADLKMYRNTSIAGFDSWCFRSEGSSKLIINNSNAKCLLDITGAIGCEVKNLSFHGERLGDKIHGIMIDHPIYDAAKEEDTPTIENCFVGSFSGSAIYFNHVWCATVRNNMLSYSENGIYHDGWDLFMCGNWLSGNRNDGFCSGRTSAAVIFCQNRIEWNANCGMNLKNAFNCNISNNQFDRAGSVQLKISSDNNDFNRNITVTGNAFNRSGSGTFLPWMNRSGYDSCHIYAEDTVNLVINSNVFHTGRDGKDKSGKRHFGPDYGIVYKHLRASIIKDNAMQSGSTKQNIVDLGDHEDNVIVKDNLGDVMESEDRWQAMLGDRDVQTIRSYFDLTDEEKKEMGID